MEKLSKQETIELRKKHIAPSLSLFFKEEPLKIVRGEGQYMFDERGQRYLDCINNVAHVGHCHPHVVAVGAEQMKTLSTNSRYLHDEMVLCARKLSTTFPDPLNVFFFVNSGSEANDLALRLASTFTKNRDIVTLEYAYHGNLSSVLEVSSYKLFQGGLPAPEHVHIAPVPDTYRGKYRDTSYPKEELYEKYAEEVRLICKSAKAEGHGVSAFIAESLQSCGGQIQYPPGYLAEVYKHVRAAGGVCIADEVQVGFGRSGKHWWAFQLQGPDVVPDIVTIGKSMGNGHPVAAVVTTAEIAKSFSSTGIEYFNTYGGNPVSCAIANAVIEVIESEDLMENAHRVGRNLINSFLRLQDVHPVIGEVRGVGFFLGLDLVKDRLTREPATEEAKYVLSRLKQNFIIISRDGPHANVIKFKPPMVFSQEDANLLVRSIDEALTEVEKMQFPKSGLINGIKN